MRVIRKITTGPDYKNGMHFEVGKPVMRESHTVKDIICTDVETYQVWVSNDKNETILWKTIEKVPVHVEHKIDY